MFLDLKKINVTLFDNVSAIMLITNKRNTPETILQNTKKFIIKHDT